MVRSFLVVWSFLFRVGVVYATPTNLRSDRGIVVDARGVESGDEVTWDTTNEFATAIPTPIPTEDADLWDSWDATSELATAIPTPSPTEDEDMWDTISELATPIPSPSPTEDEDMWDTVSDPATDLSTGDEITWDTTHVGVILTPGPTPSPTMDGDEGDHDIEN